MRNLISAVIFLLISALGTDAFACNGQGYGSSYQQAVQSALNNCSYNEQRKGEQCRAQGLTFMSTGCKDSRNSKISNGVYTASAYTNYCGCGGAVSSSIANRSVNTSRTIPYFERAVGGEFLSNSAAGSQVAASNGCQSQVASFQQACIGLNGIFNVTSSCRQIYTRQHCPEKCGVWGTGISGTVACRRR